MTRDQLHIAFKIAMDKNSQSIAFGGCPAFLPDEIDLLVESRFIPRNQYKVYW